MSEFKVEVVQIDKVESHPNADSLDINYIGGYVAITNRLDIGTPRYKVGDKVAYIPACAIVPEYLLKKFGFWNEDKNIGTLHGSEGNIVKPIRLRGIFSEGILYPAQPDWEIGQDVSSILNIHKYTQVIPETFRGHIFPADNLPLKFDIEAIEKYPDMFLEGQQVEITEKLHGTLFGLSYYPGLDLPFAFKSGLHHDQNNVLIYSKGIGASGCALKNCSENEQNLYVKIFKKYFNDQFWSYIRKYEESTENTFPLHFVGEIIGPGIQDLTYGLKEPELRIFDIKYAYDFLSPEYRSALLEDLIPEVPVLYIGEFSRELLPIYRDGQTTISNSHIREGVVIKDRFEFPNRGRGPSRRMLKAVSPHYKLRKNGTEFN